jgi:dihydropteroate synthase
MGVLNVTPDSFSDGGQYAALDRAVAQAKDMLAAGVSLIDVGGESSRPGAEPVPEQVELKRVLPVIEALAGIEGIRISIDTYKPAVMRVACGVGAHMVNDIFGLRQPGALETVAELGVPVCLMHMQGQPKNMQNQPKYTPESDGCSVRSNSGDARFLPPVVRDVRAFFVERVEACIAAGIAEEHICLDPGFGFGKTLADNLHLMRHLAVLDQTGRPILIGVSRKSMIGQLLGQPISERLSGGLGLAFHALEHGVKVIRTHDVVQTKDIVRIWQALQADPEGFR